MTDSRPEVDFLSGRFYVEGARDAYHWLRDNEPVYFDEKNELWGVATYDGVLAPAGELPAPDAGGDRVAGM